MSDDLFFDSAMQYYVAGRGAFFAKLTPVAANLLHHAVEMFLKGAIPTAVHRQMALIGTPHRQALADIPGTSRRISTFTDRQLVGEPSHDHYVRHLDCSSVRRTPDMAV